jgi:hypothetical protein
MKIPKSFLKYGDNEKKEKKAMGKMSRSALKKFKKADDQEDKGGN